MEAAIGLKPLKIGNLVAKHPVIQGGMGVEPFVLSRSSREGGRNRNHFHSPDWI
jgi:hypothetical protein